MSVNRRAAKTSTFVGLRESRTETPISFTNVNECDFPVTVRGSDPNESSATLYFPHFEELKIILKNLTTNVTFNSPFKIVGKNWYLSPNGQYLDMNVNEFPDARFFGWQNTFTMTNWSNHIFPLRLDGSHQHIQTQQAMNVLGIVPSGFFFPVNSPNLYAQITSVFTYPVVFVIPGGPITSDREVEAAAKGIGPGGRQNFNLRNMFIYELLDVVSAIFSHPDCHQRHHVVAHGRRFGIEDITPVCVGTSVEALNKYRYMYRILKNISNSSPVFKDPVFIFFGSHHMIVPITNTSYRDNRNHAIALNQDYGRQVTPFALHDWTHNVSFTSIRHDYYAPHENFEAVVGRFSHYLEQYWHFAPGDVALVPPVPHIQVQDSFPLSNILRLRTENSPQYNSFIQQISEIFHTPLALVDRDLSAYPPFVEPLNLLPEDYLMMRTAF